MIVRFLALLRLALDFLRLRRVTLGLFRLTLVLLRGRDCTLSSLVGGYDLGLVVIQVLRLLFEFFDLLLELFILLSFLLHLEV